MQNDVCRLAQRWDEVVYTGRMFRQSVLALAVAGRDENGPSANLAASPQVAQPIANDPRLLQYNPHLLARPQKQSRGRFSAFAAIPRCMRTPVPAANLYAFRSQHFRKSTVDLQQPCLGKHAAANGRLIGYNDQRAASIAQLAQPLGRTRK